MHPVSLPNLEVPSTATCLSISEAENTFRSYGPVKTSRRVPHTGSHLSPADRPGKDKLKTIITVVASVPTRYQLATSGGHWEMTDLAE